jgi:hypothetical protein
VDCEGSYLWKIVPGGNSGFMWGVKEDEKYHYPYQKENEYLGDERWKGFGKFSKGPICFQDHPGMVSFRNIVIRELD